MSPNEPGNEPGNLLRDESYEASQFFFFLVLTSLAKLESLDSAIYEPTSSNELKITSLIFLQCSNLEFRRESETRNS